MGFLKEFEVLSHVEKVVTTFVPDAASAERNWSLHIRHHMKSRNQFKAENLEKVSMVKHQYIKKKTLSNKKVVAAYEKLLHPTKSISAKLLFQAFPIACMKSEMMMKLRLKSIPDMMVS